MTLEFVNNGLDNGMITESTHFLGKIKLSTTYEIKYDKESQIRIKLTDEETISIVNNNDKEILITVSNIDKGVSY
jgi:ribosome maturation factor RimP